MLRVRAFQGVRPADDLVPAVACVPYDVVDTAEAAALAAGNPHSLLHVDRAEIDLPPGTNPHDDAVYARARANFEALIHDGVLRRESERSIYLYRQRMGEHTQTGVAAVCHIDDYQNGVIKRHERTRKDKEDDRARLIGSLRANTGPVFLTYRDRREMDALVEEGQRANPSASFVAPDGIEHTVWKIAGGDRILEEMRRVPCAYVADGHHRTASAVRVGLEHRAANGSGTGDEDYNWFLAVLFPSSQLQILPYNRCVHDLNGLDVAGFINRVAGDFRIVHGSSDRPSAPGAVSMYIDRCWHSVSWEKQPMAAAAAALDVSVLQERLLGPILGIDDPRTSTRIDFIGGIRGTRELEERVDSGQAAVAFSLFPTTVDQLMAIADADGIMPPKSTWFEPKLRSGLFIHTF